MALKFADRVQETSTTSGTGTLSLLGPINGYQSFVSGLGSGNTTFYAIYDNVAQLWEVGIGTITSGTPDTLTRTTVLANSSGTTSPISLVGNTVNVWCDYPAEKVVILDSSGNVTPLGTVASGTWQGTTVGVAYGGTGVTASSGANSVVLRDANANVTFNNFTASATATTATGGTTVLTAASARTQILVGSTTHTFQLPDATTLQLGQSFVFVNNSSDALTVADNASTTIEVVPSGGITQLGAVSIATSAGSWGAYSFIPAAVNWGTNTLQLSTTVISGGTWQGGTIQSGYGGTGLTTFGAANYALYSTSSSALTAGTLPVPAGGTGQTSFSSGYIPYGNTTAALQSSNKLQFNGDFLLVGGTAALGGTTNPIVAFTGTANNYVQTYTYNASNGTSASADYVAYADNSTDTHGWADIGFTSSTYSDASYSITGPNEAYVLGSAPTGSGASGNLVYATDSTGIANYHQWYVGGFNKAKNEWSMQLTPTGLQLANTLATTYGGTGLASFTSGGALYATSTSALTTGTLPVASGGTGATTASANYVFAGPTTGSAAAPSFRALVAADIPSTYSQFAAGTKLVFAQASAPTGWTQIVDDTADNRMLRVVKTTGAGTGGTASPILNDVVPSHTHTYSSTSGSGGVDHTHSISGSGTTSGQSADHSHSGTTSGQSADHAHYTSGTSGYMNQNWAHNHTAYARGSPSGFDWLLDGGGGGAYSPGTNYTDVNHTHNWGNWSGGVNANHTHTITTGGVSVGHTHTWSFTGTSGAASAYSHTHSVSGTTAANGSASNWAPRYIDTIVCSKN